MAGFHRVAGLVALALVWGTTAEAARKPKPEPAAPASQATAWTATWEASPEPPRAPVVITGNQTVRQVARVSVGGIWTRLRLSNEFGDKPLTISSAHFGLAGPGGSVQQGSDRTVTFGGAPFVTIPPHARVVSDPISLTVPPLSSVAVSLFFPGQVGDVTEHYFGLATGWIAPGNMTASPALTPATTFTKRVVLTGIEVATPPKVKSVVVLGDSITGGYGSTADANRRWPDRLAERLAQRQGGPLAVVNAGIGGNRLLHDFIGPNALSRFDRDVLTQANVGYVIVLIGINDFGFPGGRNLPQEDVTAEAVIAGYKQLIAQANTSGIRVIGATMPPFGPIPERPGYYSEASAAKRAAVNQWIRTSRAFHGVVDFDAALRDPANANAMSPAYDSGDHLNPNDAGYQAMANAVDLKLFDN